ncbi:MAG: hypothetical protein ACON5A_00075 [Candidatus Comchoanobacterales bacterium]
MASEDHSKFFNELKQTIDLYGGFVMAFKPYSTSYYFEEEEYEKNNSDNNLILKSFVRISKLLHLPIVCLEYLTSLFMPEFLQKLILRFTIALRHIITPIALFAFLFITFVVGYIIEHIPGLMGVIISKAIFIALWCFSMPFSLMRHTFVLISNILMSTAKNAQEASPLSILLIPFFLIFNITQSIIKLIKNLAIELIYDIYLALHLLSYHYLPFSTYQTLKHLNTENSENITASQVKESHQVTLFAPFCPKFLPTIIIQVYLSIKLMHYILLVTMPNSIKQAITTILWGFNEVNNHFDRDDETSKQAVHSNKFANGPIGVSSTKTHHSNENKEALLNGVRI